jgi:hypothetical protein
VAGNVREVWMVLRNEDSSQGACDGNSGENTQNMHFFFRFHKVNLFKVKEGKNFKIKNQAQAMLWLGPVPLLLHFWLAPQ